jgi:hypothetical protein
MPRPDPKSVWQEGFEQHLLTPRPAARTGRGGWGDRLQIKQKHKDRANNQLELASVQFRTAFDGGPPAPRILWNGKLRHQIATPLH